MADDCVTFSFKVRDKNQNPDDKANVPHVDSKIPKSYIFPGLKISRIILVVHVFCHKML